ncbi:MAG: GyrI-like domain-containing protein [Crocinitomicaceae bacterium]|nr:GyrI-like domain-containing protein [Crocinitomicaceae bacterium]
MDIKYVSKMYPAVRAEELDTTVYNAAYREIYKIVPANNIAGVPMSIWRNYNEQTNTVDIEIAVPVGTEIKVPTGLIAGKIPGGKVIKHIHYGNYNKIGKAWDKLMEYIGKNNKPRHDGFEMYVKGPANTTNEEEYVTWLIVPVE